MPSKKKKYNARFPAGRIKKIMQTDEEVGKVAQAVPIIISRTLELFVESLLSKAMQVTMARNAKTLSPSHVKQCILAESRFDFLRDLVKNIPDVSAAEEKEMMSAESSPNSSRFSDMSVPPRRVLREDSNSSSSCDVKLPPPGPPAPPAPAPLSREHLKRGLSTDPDIPHKLPRESINDDPYPAYVPKEPTCTVTSATAIDLSKKEEVRANFYHDTLEDVPLRSGSVITVNPTYSSPQPSTSYTNLTRVPPVQKIDIPPPKVNFERHNSLPRTPVTPIINIDFSKNLSIPEIKVLDPTNISVPKNDKKTLSRQNSKSKIEVRKIEIKPVTPQPPPVAPPIDIDRLNSGNLQIDEDYDT